MSFRWNQFVSNQRSYWTAPVDAGTLAFAWSAWIYADDRTLTGALFSIDATASNIGLRIILANQKIQFRRQTTSGATDFDGVESANGVTANATYFHIVAQNTGVATGTTSGWQVWVNGVALSLTNIGTSTDPFESLAGGTWDWGNIGDLASAFKGRVRDAAVWTAANGTTILTQSDVDTLYASGSGTPPRFLTPASGATLRHAPAFCAPASQTTTYCPIIAALASHSNAPGSPATPDKGVPSLTATPAYYETPVNTTSIMGCWDARKYTSGTAAGRLIDWSDLSGNGNTWCYASGYSSPPGSINSGSDVHVALDNPGGTLVLLISQCASTFSNGNFAFSAIMAKSGTNVGANVLRAVTTNNLTISTNNSGFLVIRMNSTDHTCTKARIAANRCHVGISVSQTSASSAKTIEVFIDGAYVETLTTGAFSEVTTNRLERLGASSSTSGAYQTFWHMLFYSAAKTQSEMAAIASQQMAAFGVTAAGLRRGVVILHGSSSMDAGQYTTYNRDWAYLVDWGRARVFKCAVAGSFFTSHEYVVSTSTGGANATPFTNGETIQQTGTGDTYQFVLETGGYLFMNRLSGTGTDKDQNLTGLTSGAIRDPSAAGSSGSGSSVGQTAAAQIDVVNALISDTNYAGDAFLFWQVGANDIPAGPASAALANALVDAYGAYVSNSLSLPGSGRTLFNVVVSPHPRVTGTYLANLVAGFVAAVGGNYDYMVNYTVNEHFNDFSTSTDYQNPDYFQVDEIHLKYAGYVLAAPYFQVVADAALGLFTVDTSGARFSRSVERFRRFGARV